MYVSLYVDYRICKEKLQHSASLSSLTGVNKMLHNASLLHKLKDFKTPTAGPTCFEVL